jgi:hypothetical protein
MTTCHLHVLHALLALIAASASSVQRKRCARCNLPRLYVLLANKATAAYRQARTTRQKVSFL